MAQNKIITAADPFLVSIPIKETHDPVVDLLKDYPEIKCDNSATNMKSVTKEFSKVRKTVAEKLLKAQNNLPKGIYLFIKEGLRPIDYQKKLFLNYLKKLKDKNPKWSDQKIYSEAAKFIAPPENVPPHSTGGVLDLVLIDENSKEIDLGRFPDNNSSYDDTCPTYSEKISEIVKENRKILIDAMEKAGFVNYVLEWWHWSYGDRYWAYRTKSPYALFGSVKLKRA